MVLGLLLIIAGGAWKFGIAPQNDARFPDGWVWEVDSLGLTVWADETTGEFPAGVAMEDDPINVSERIVTAEMTEQTDNKINLVDSYETRDPATNVVTWDFTSTTVVDPQTGKILEGDTAGDYYFLPHQVDKNETYVISNNSYVSLSMKFQGEEVLAGINSYKFGHYSDINNTLSYIGWVEVEDGQEITCFDFELEYWVEPITGEIVKYREWCPGDYVVDTETGESLYGISRWASETTGDDLIRRASTINSMLATYNMNNTLIPAGLAIVGIVLIILGFYLDKSSADNSKREDA